ncbi:MAG TPA: DHA2 family efflux MFS transporter permease subunit [Jatrophihabitans sp.]|nr:DHA2 family efflux MFS transporter permease subunit [Jatrophihabitans sp.]
MIPTWAVLAVCCVAQFMVVLDVSIVNVALPGMRADLDLSATGQQWIINAYTLTFAGFMLLGGRAADLFGRRRVFVLGLSVFTICSLLGGLAEIGGELIAARAVQGVGAAILAPATLSLITTTFTEPGARRRALGAWSATQASAAAAGVLAGGVLTDVLDWRWVLFVNVPIGTALIAAALVSLTESRSDNRPRLDVGGAATVTGGLALLVYGIVSTDSRAWGSAATIGTLLGATALLAVFVLIESRLSAQPLVPLSVFRLRSLAAANGIAVMIGAALFGTYYFVSLYLQQTNGYSPLQAGLAFLPVGLATLIGALCAARLVPYLGVRGQLITGLVLVAGGLVLLGQLSTGDSYFGHVFGALVLAGLGVGLSFVPLTIAATADVPMHQAGLASGLINTTRQIGGAVGLAVMATAATSSGTAGYGRAFWIAAAATGIGAGLAVALPGKTKPAPQATRHEKTAESPEMIDA